MKITEKEILEEIQKCKEDVNYFYQKYYAPGIEEGKKIKACDANYSTLVDLAVKKLGHLPYFMKKPKDVI
jgi:hypothetical protein